MLPALLFSLACPDLSGTYRLEGSDQGGCYAHHGMETTPFPVKTAIAEGDRVEIRQKDCSFFEVTYLDRMDPAFRKATRSFRMDPDSTSAHRVSRDRRDAFGVPGLGPYGSHSRSWSIRKNRNGNLIFKFRSQNHGSTLGTGAGGLSFDVAHSRCFLRRVSGDTAPPSEPEFSNP